MRYTDDDDGDRAYDAWKDGETTHRGEWYEDYRRRTAADRAARTARTARNGSNDPSTN